MAIVGKVVALTGTAYIITDNGDKRELQLGDTVQTSDTIQTMAGAEVELDMTNGRSMRIGPDQLVAFTPELTNALGFDVLDGEVNLATIETVIKAIESGKDINEVLQETAAGSAGSRIERGFDFVALLRIVDPLNQFGFNYDFNFRANIEDQPISGRIIDDDANRLGGAGGSVSAPVVVSSITSDAQVEGTPLVHTVTLSNASSSITTYPFTIGGGNATAGTDYTATPTFSNGVTLAAGVLTVPIGVTSFTMTVPTTLDTIDEGVNETYNISVGGVSAVGTITDDDNAPTIATVTADTQVEGTPLVHTVTLSNASSSITTYPFTIGGGNATAGTDYTATPTFSNGVTLAAGVLTVPIGVTSFTMTVPTTLDTIDEGVNETYNISVGGVSAVGTITDDDNAPTITSVEPGAPGVGDDAVPEGTDLVYTVNLSNPSSVATTYPFSLGAGTSTAALGDIGAPVFSNGVTLVAGILTVPLGVTSFTVTVPTTQDVTDEPNETVELTIGGVTGTGVIIDDDGAPNITAITSDVQVEGTPLVHTVTLSNASSSITTYPFTIGGGNATAGTDYTATPTFSNGVTLAAGVLTVPIGVTSFTMTVPTTLDTIDEGVNETYNISVGGVSAVGTITDDDNAPTIATVTADTQVEGTPLVHTVTLSNASSSITTYPFTIGGGNATAGTDYTATPTFSNGVTLAAGVLTVPIGVTSFTMTVPTTLDTIDEGVNETYNISVGGVSAVGTITDDDNAPTIATVTADTQVEGTPLVHTVTLSNASSSITTYPFTIGGGNATAGTDYTATPTFSNGVTLAAGVLTVPIGVTSFTMTVPTTLDTIDEGVNETYNISVGGVSAVGTITDDDNAPTIATVTADTQVEGTPLVHTVTLSNASSSITTYPFTIGGGNATAGTDYTATPTFSNGVTLAAGVLTVPIGVTSFTMTVPTTLDTIDEGVNETYNISVGGVSAVGTITDDDNAPTIATVTADTQVEGTPLVHTVTLSNASSSITTYPFTIGGGNATAGTDYTATPTFSNGVTLAAGVLTVPIGVTSFTMTVPTTLDTIDEGVNETYNISVGGVSAVGTITDDDNAPTIATVTADTQVEGTPLVHTVTLSNASSSITTYPFTIGGGNATAGTDYTATPTFSNGVTLAAGVLTVPIGVTSFTMTVPTTLDTIDEGVNETYNISVGGVSAVGTITDDDNAPTIATVTADTQVEGTPLVHTVTLSNASSSITTYPFTIGGGNATAGTDYTATPTFSNGVTLAAGVLTVPIGVTSFTMTVPTTLDTIDEGVNETYNISVGGVSAVGTITDDDNAPTIATVTADTQVEGTPLVHTVTLSNASSSITTYPFTIGGGNATAGTDYTATPTFSNGVTLAAGVLTVPIGVTSFTMTVPTTLDTIDEGVNETYNISVGGVSAVGTITDDDNAPTIATVTADTQVEGTPLVHTVTLSNASSSITTYPFTIGGGNATAGTDYTATPTFSNGVTLAAGVLTVPIGVTSFTMTVPTTLDTIDEGVNETYNISVGGVSAVGTITDDDNAPTIATVTADTQVEGTPLVHTVTLSNASSSITTYPFTIGGGNATAGTDYTATPTFSNGVTLAAGVLTVPIGVTSFTMTVPTTLDTIDEGVNETYNISVGGVSAVGTITDDDNAPTIATVTADTQVEGTPLVHTVTLSNASSSITTYPFTIGGGNATAGTDYTATPTFSNGVTLAAGVLTVPIGVTSFTMTVPTTLDTIDEGVNETYNISVGGVSAVGTITDDDNAPTIATVTADTQVEGTPLVHTVTLSNASSSITTYPFTIGGGNATAGTDYTATPTFSNGVTLAAGVLTVPIGVTSFTMTVPTTLDTIDEGVNETYNISVGGVSAVGTITDDDNAPTIATVTADTQVEGTPLVHTVTLSNASSSITTYPFTIGGGNATAGTDYTATPTFSNGVTLAAGVLTVPIGVTSFTMTVPTTLDTIDEGVNETYNISVGGVSAVGTITDDDNAPTIATVTADTQVEGTPLVHTVTLSNASSSITTYPFTIGGGNATAGTDYTATPTFSNGVTLAAGVLTVPIGVTSFTMTVPTTLDTIDEGVNETYNISVGGVSAVGTITDDDNAPTIATVTADTQVEGTPLVHTVTLSNASSSITTYPFTIGGGNATAGTDYTATPTFSNGVTLAAGVLTVPIGVTSFTMTVPTTLDTIDEGVNETYNISVGGVSAVGTITDDDNAPTIATVTADTQVEGTPLVHTVTLSNASSSITTYPFTIGGGNATAGTDYTATPTFSNGVTLAAGVLTVPIGVTSFTMTVPTTLDTIDEGVNETYNISVGGVSAVGTITDDDNAPTIATVTADTQVEGTPLVHTVTLSNASSSITTYPFTIGGGNATAGTDYTATPTFSNGVTLAAGVLTVPIGVTSFTMTVPTTLDTIDEGVNETYNISVGGVSAVGTITDDDNAPTIATVTADTQVEGTPLVHTVTLSNASSSITTYPFTIGGGNATAGTDYTATPTFSNGVTLAAGVLTVPIGVTSFTMTVPTTLDTIDEGVNETYNISVGGVSAVGTITDDDNAPTIATVTADTQVEGTPLVHTVTLSNASSSITTYPFTIGGGNATAGTDYTATPTFSNGVTLAAGVLTVPIGVTSFTMTVPTTLDTIDEGVNETYNISVGGVSAVGTITDDDNAPTIATVTADTQVEGTPLVHTVTLSNASSSITTYPFTIGGGNATAGTDYTATPTFSNGVTLAAGVLTVPIGVTSFTMTVPTTLDTIDEGVNETYNISVGGVSAVGTITDDDNAPTIATVTADTQVEGTPLVHTVTLSNASSSITTYPFTIGGGNATAGTDYTATPTFSNGVTLAAGVLTVPIGVTSFTMTVPTTLDTIDEGVNETYNISVGGVSAVGTITDDDNAPTIASIDSPSIVEGGNLVYSVNLSNPSSTDTTYPFTLGGGSASAGDIGAPTFSNGVTLALGVLTVPAGVTSFTVTVPTTQDILAEGNELVPLTIGGATGTGTIIDDEPTIDLDGNNSSGALGSNYTTTFTENGAAVSIADTDIVILDPVSLTMASATITLTNAQVGDVLAAVSGGGITASVVGNVVTLSGTATLAQYQTAIQAITFANTTDNPNATPRNITVTLNDGINNTNTAIATVNVVPVNDPPTLDLDLSVAGTGYTTSYTENAAGTPISDTDITITDVDDTNIENATITLTNPQTGDVLAALGALPGGITAVVSGGGSVVTLSGTATLAQYQAAIRLIGFSNTTENPNTTPRTINVVVNDGTANSNTAVTTIAVTAVNDPPTLDLDLSVAGTGYTTSYTENAAGTPISDTDITITDVDDTNIENATITLTNPQTGDVLAALGALPGGITAVVSGGGSVVTLSGTATLAQYQAAIRLIGFSNTTENPNTTPRTINVVVNDGTANSNTAVTTIAVTAVNDPPTLDLDLSVAGTGYTTSYTENAAGTPISDTDITITDVDDTNIENATITLTNPQTGDVLAALGALPGGITAVVSGGGSVVTLSGTATLAQYQAAIRLIGFSNTTENPNTTPRTINVVVNDGTANSNTAVTTIAVTAVNDPPTLDLDLSVAGTGYTTSYTENAAGTPISDTDITITDVDDTNIENATITLTNPQTGDVLAALGALPGGITAVVSGGGSVVTLSGTATLAQYQAAIRLIGFSNTTENPNTTPRTINVVVNDGTANSNTAVTTIAVTAVNDPPTLDLDLSVAGTGYTTSYTENAAGTPISDTDITITDVDDTNIENATITLTNPQTGDVLAALGALPGGITAVVSGGGSVVTLSGTATLAQYQAAIRLIGFSNTTENPNTTPRTINVVVNDGTANSNTAVTTIAVTAVNDPPTLDLDLSVAGTGYTTSYTENAAGTPISDTDITITDVDDTNIENATITLTNPQTGDVLAALGALPGGITAVVSGGGSVVTLSGTATLAQYQAAIRLIGFSNTTENPNTTPRTINVVVNDGTANSNTAVTTIAVTAVNDAPVGVADNYTAVEGTATVKTTVLVNDTDPEGNALTVAQFATNNTGLNASTANGTNTITTALGGTVVMNVNGTFTYTAPARNHGDVTPDVDSFAYKPNDGSLSSAAWTTVTINITDTNPLANNDVDSVGIGSTVAGNVITGAGGVTADTLNVDSPHSLTNVVLTAGTQVSNILGAGNVRTIVTTRGTLAIDQDDGSYTYTASVAPIVVTNPNGIASFTGVGINLYGFDTAEPYNTAGNVNSGLNLGNLNATSAARARFQDNAGETDDGFGAEQNAGTSATNATENGEQMVISLGVASKSTSIALSNLLTGEVATWETYNAAGAIVSSGTTAGVASGLTNINISSGTAFNYVVVRSTGAASAYRVDGITVIPEPTGATDVFTYTLTDSDGDTSNATLTMNYDTTTTTNSDTATVYESGINANGTQASGTQEAQTIEIATGNVLANDTGVSSFSTFTISGGTIVGGTVNASAPDVNGVVTVTVTDTTSGSRTIATITLYTQDFGANVKGDYAVNLVGRTTDGAGTNDSFTVNYTLTNSVSGEVDNASLTVDVVDDVPTVQDAIVQVQQGVLPKQNLVFVIDSSGSMEGEVKSVAANGTVTIMNRLQATQLAVAAVINEYFSQGGNVSITLVDFDTTAANRGTYTTAASAITALNLPANFTVGGGTNYEAALTTAQAAIGTPVVGEKYTVYFISDGVPTQGDTTDPAANGYRAFATTNNITTYAIGIASDISNPTELNNIHNVDSDISGVKDAAIIVTNVATLDDVLLASVPTSFGGSVAGSAANSSLNFGADGGYISQLIMRLDTDGDNVPDADVTFNFNPTTGVITLVGGGTPQTGFPLTSDTLTLNNANGFEDGILIFNFRTGEYVYQTAGFATEGEQFDIKFTATDGDGDTASGIQTVQIVDGKPEANNDIDTLMGNSTFFEGNVISAIGTDGGDSVALTSFSTNRSGEDNPGDNGSVSSIVFKGLTFDLTTLVGSTPALGGNYTVTSIAGVNTLTWTATAGGSSLVFNEEGYYKYTPPTAEIVNNVAGASTNYTLTSGALVTTAATAGMTLAGIARTSATEGSAAVNTPNADGVGIVGNTNTRIDSLESLVITFDTSTHPHGVQGVTITVDTSNSNLGGTNAFNYSVYNVHGELIAQFASNTEGAVVMPANLTGIGKIVIDAGGVGAYPGSFGSISAVRYSSILDTVVAAAPAPEVITYTLTDTDGDTSSATLTLNNIIDDIAGTAANNTINGTARNENISGLAGDDTINAGAGFDIVRGGDGNDIIDGGADDDQLYGNAGNDTISGGTGKDTIYGDAGNDTLNGNDGDDFISGGDGNDIITGGLGADVIIGGAGSDTLTGGAGVDVFRWELADRGTIGSPATDVITDFDPAAVGGDVLDIRDMLTGEQHVSGTGNLTSYLHFEVVGANTIVHISNNGGFSNGFSPSKDVQRITLTGVDLVTGFADDQAIIQNLLTNNKLITD